MTQAQLEYAKELGLTPARMRLMARGKDSAFDIAAAIAVETAEEVEDARQPSD